MKERIAELKNKREMALNLLAENVLTESGKEKVINIINTLTKDIEKAEEENGEIKATICYYCKHYEKCKKYVEENFQIWHENIGFCVRYEKK